MMKRVFKYFCSIILLLQFPIVLIPLLPIYAFRFFVSYVLIRFYPDVHKLMSTRSSILGSDSIYKSPKLSIVFVFILEGKANLENLSKLFLNRVVNQKNPDGSFLKPEFQQYVTTLGGFLAWKWETQFDINSHFAMYEGKYKNQLINNETLQDIMNELLNKPFSPKKSPWHVHVIHNYRETDLDLDTRNAKEPESTALVLQIHHCLGDGYSILKAFIRDFGGIKNLEVAQPKSTQSTGSSKVSQIFRALDFVLSVPYELVCETLYARDVNSWHVPEKQLKRIMNSAVSHPISMAYLKEIKNQHSVTFEALLIDGFTAATRKFMIEAGFSVPDTIHCAMPLPVSGHPNKMTNHAKIGFCTLSVGLTDSQKRLEASEKNLAHLKRSSYPVATFHLMPLVGGLFRWMLALLVRNSMATAHMTNFPGPNNVYVIDDNTVHSITFGCGFGEGNCGIGFASMSYNGTIRIAVGIDEGIVARNTLPATKLIKYLLDEMEILRKSIQSKFNV